MAVITISREFGSYSETIIKRVAELCAIPLVDKAILADLLTKYGLLDFESFYDSEHNFIDRFDTKNDTYIKMMNQALLAFAKRDNLIILGRGGFSLLKGFDNVLNVMLKAPRVQRAIELIESGKVSEGQSALMIIDQKDTVRQKFLQMYYGVKTLEAQDFDLVIDASKISTEMAAQWISQAYAELSIHSLGNKNVTRELEVDPVLFRAVEDYLL